MSLLPSAPGHSFVPPGPRQPGSKRRQEKRLSGLSCRPLHARDEIHIVFCNMISLTVQWKDGLTGGASRKSRLVGGLRARPSTSSGQAPLRKTEGISCFVIVSLSNHTCRKPRPVGGKLHFSDGLSHSLLECENAFPVVIHVYNNPAFGLGFVKRVVEAVDWQGRTFKDGCGPASSLKFLAPGCSEFRNLRNGFICYYARLPRSNVRQAHVRRCGVSACNRFQHFRQRCVTCRCPAGSSPLPSRGRG